MMVWVEVPQKVGDNCGFRSSSLSDQDDRLFYLHVEYGIDY